MSDLTRALRALLLILHELDVSVTTPWFSGTTTSSTYGQAAGKPVSRDGRRMDSWSGEKSWSDLGSTVNFAATSDRTGHISLFAMLNGQDGHTQLRTCLMFEAGQLQTFATDVAALFE